MVFPGFNGGNINKAHDVYESITGESHTAKQNYKGMVRMENVIYVIVK